MTTELQVPEWLAKRDGTIQTGIRPETRFILVGGQPLYRLDVRPAAGVFTCAVVNATNSHRLDNPAATYPGMEAAFAGGLDQLRERLGW